MTKMRPYPILELNMYDIEDSFCDEDKDILDLNSRITQGIFDVIAIRARDIFFADMGESFWLDFNVAVQKATMECLDFEFDEELKLVKGESHK